MLQVLNKALREQCIYVLCFHNTFQRRQYRGIIGSCLEREMADGWYGEWTDWRNDSEQQAPKEPPKKRLHPPYAFLAAL